MPKKPKIQTPEWITGGYDNKADWEKAKGIKKDKKVEAKKVEVKEPAKEEKKFKIRECPKCGSDKVGLVLSGSDAEEDSGTGKEWKCETCDWQGEDIQVKKLTEDELMAYLDNKGEECC
jgi:DNA-directed RNA polymerase subunit M/transcription elongation factor TFIIS